MHSVNQYAVIMAALVGVVSTALADEPNNSFESPTFLAQGVSSVLGELTLAIFPDTLLGARNAAGEIDLVDDDSSPFGDGHASALPSVSTHSGTIRFDVSGFGDNVTDGEFAHDHVQSGTFEVFVDVFDEEGGHIESFSQIGELAANDVVPFEFTKTMWMNAVYDVYIDNTVGRSDVDFYKFTELPSGATFEARIFDELESGVVTNLGLFDETGLLVTADADSGENGLSLISGTVTSSGSLTFAVTGLGDDDFTGLHAWSGTYQLVLTVLAPVLDGDLNRDHSVDAADYVMWRKNGGFLAEYEVWTENFGRSLASIELSATDSEALTAAEPATCILVWLLLVPILLWRSDWRAVVT
jgi:hypothetical protein